MGETRERRGTGVERKIEWSERGEEKGWILEGRQKEEVCIDSVSMRPGVCIER
jgi:hypothetical protein